MKAKSHFAAVLEAILRKRDLSAYALGKLAGLHPQAVRYLHKGARAPSWETVQRLAKALKLPYETFADPDLEVPMQGPSKSGPKPSRSARKPPAQKPRRPRAGKGKGE
jgi:transcriptional regulator with XRE-family HTH domain